MANDESGPSGRCGRGATTGALHLRPAARRRRRRHQDAGSVGGVGSVGSVAGGRGRPARLAGGPVRPLLRQQQTAHAARQAAGHVPHHRGYIISARYRKRISNGRCFLILPVDGTEAIKNASRDDGRAEVAEVAEVAGLARLERVHLLLSFYEFLERFMFNAFDGCSGALPAAPKVTPAAPVWNIVSMSRTLATRSSIRVYKHQPLIGTD